jgi:hypothetical protein
MFTPGDVAVISTSYTIAFLGVTLYRLQLKKGNGMKRGNTEKQK